MPNQPIILATVKITATDINGNRTAKQFSNVLGMSFDYNKGMLNIVDATGSYYFSLTIITLLTYTIALGASGSHTITVF